MAVDPAVCRRAPEGKVRIPTFCIELRIAGNLIRSSSFRARGRERQEACILDDSDDTTRSLLWIKTDQHKRSNYLIIKSINYINRFFLFSRFSFFYNRIFLGYIYLSYRDRCFKVLEFSFSPQCCCWFELGVIVIHVRCVLIS